MASVAQPLSDRTSDHTAGTWSPHSVVSFVHFLFSDGLLYSAMISFLYLLVIFVFVCPVHSTISSRRIGTSGLFIQYPWGQH